MTSADKVLTLHPKCAHNVYMSRTSNRHPQHFLLTRNGETVATDSKGSHSGLAAHVRMLDRMASAAGVDRLRPSDETGRTFHGGFALEGPFEVLR